MKKSKFIPLVLKYAFVLLLLSSNMFRLSSQSLRGKTTNKSNIAIEGVHILNLSNGRHAHSDEHGLFEFQHVHIGDTLKFTHISYAPLSYIVSHLDDEALSVVLEKKAVSIDEVVIKPQINALNLITDIDIHINPVNSSQEILRQVPGLVIGQHAGGGKAEQMFLRGFDIDHGTDIAITADGLPVNMVSHAHGQGYADLHFIIPETVEKVDFGKGPYYADKGNFNTAGYVNFISKDRLANSALKLESGMFNTHRLLGMFNVLSTNKHHAYVASEYMRSDGAFTSPQNFNRINVFAKYNGMITANDKIGFSLSHFTSKWDASGQIPQRAVDDGSITRFGAIDDTEGGQTSRSNFSVRYEKYINDHTSIKNTVYISTYDFDLFSNFTFFLEDPINGDQIRQKESRTIYGLNSVYNQAFNVNKSQGLLKIGMDLRHDESLDNELSHTLNRYQTLNQIQLGDIYESNFGAFINLNLTSGPWVINPSLRYDWFDFQYMDALQTQYQVLASSEGIVSPKINILYNASKDIQLYLKAGKGFHSNDTRLALGDDDTDMLTAAYGSDLGIIWKPIDRMLINWAYWYLFLEQEFVYVGDAGVVEPSGRTRRQGIDLSARYQILDWLFWNFDANYTLARATDEAPGEDYIPLAPDLTMVSGIHILHPGGLYAGAEIRYIKDRPANEDNSIVAKGYQVVDMNIGYEWHSLDFGVQIQNLLDTEWNETQFATETRLQYELMPVEEIHFIPGTPFFIKGIIKYSF